MTNVMTMDPPNRRAINLGAILRGQNAWRLLVPWGRQQEQAPLPELASLFNPLSGGVPQQSLELVKVPQPRRIQPQLGPITLPEMTTVSVPGVEGTLTNWGRDAAFQDTGDVKVRFAGPPPRYMNAVTLKKVAGLPRAVLLRRDGDVWRRCEDSWRIDLEDATVEYRLGDVSIYS